jgi:hypothetical protein
MTRHTRKMNSAIARAKTYLKGSARDRHIRLSDLHQDVIDHYCSLELDIEGMELAKKNVETICAHPHLVDDYSSARDFDDSTLGGALVDHIVDIDYYVRGIVENLQAIEIAEAEIAVLNSQ